MGDHLSATDFKTSMDKILAEITSVRDELTTLKGDQSRLTVAVNRLQTDNHKPESSGGNDDHRAPNPPPPHTTHKLRFPKYDGSDDPIGWLHKCEQFFRSQRTPEDEKVWTASFYMEGPAQQWYYRLERNQGVPTWQQFVTSVNRRFGPPVRSNPLGELTHLRRTGTVAAYQDAFLQLLARCDDVTECQQVDIFTAGLRNPLRIDVEMQRPTSLEDAMSLARAFERRLQIDNDDDGRASSHAPPRSAPSASPRTPKDPPNRVPQETPGAPGRPAPKPGVRFTRLTPQEMAQRRPLLQLPGEVHPRPHRPLLHERHLPAGTRRQHPRRRRRI
jgi:hypothetical protein